MSKIANLCLRNSNSVVILSRKFTLRNLLGDRLSVNYGQRLFSVFSTPEANQELSYFSGAGEEPLLGYTIGNVIDRAASIYGTKEAIVVCSTSTRKNFVELKQEVDKVAAGFLALGLNRGDRIGIWSTNSYEWVLTQFGAAKAGLILVNINPSYNAYKLAYCLEKVGVRALVSASNYGNQDNFTELKKVVPTLTTSLPGHIQCRLKNLTHIIMISGKEKEQKGVFKFMDVANIAQNSDIERVEELQHVIQFDDPANIQFTADRSESVKGATLSHFNVVNNSYFLGRRMLYHETTHRICLNVPLHHCFGCVGGSLAGVMFGACQVYPSPIFNAVAAAQAIRDESCTSLYGTPSMFTELMNLPDFKTYDMSSIKTGIMFSLTSPDDVLKTAIKTFKAPGLCVCYGSSETSPVITQTLPEDSLEKRASTVGTVLEHTEVKIVDTKTGLVVPCGKTGELWTRGYLVMLGYWNEPEITKEIITPNRWFKTGDLAVADKNGYIKVIGRIRDMIFREGKNIFPNEIEEFLTAYHKIAEVYVVGVPDKRKGEEMCAWIRLKKDETMTEEELREYCEGKIAHFKIPRYFKFVKKFPVTITGQIQKSVMRKKSCQELGLE